MTGRCPVVVEAQATLPMAAFWGTGRTASSDGQFFPAAGRGEALNLVNARYGTEPGLKAYSHVSDRYSPFATQTIPATVHEAPYILDGLLMNETGRRVREQYAVTAGFTDHVFTACSIVARLDVHRETVRPTVDHESYGVWRGLQLCRLVQRPRLESGRAVCRRMVILQPSRNGGPGVRPVCGRVLFLSFLYVSRGPAAVEHGPHVGVRLFEWRDAVVAPHGARPGVVGGQGENGPELVGAAQVGDAGVDVLPGVEGAGDAEVALRARNKLHQALGSGWRLRGCAVR